MTGNFDVITPVYDILRNLVFGKAPENAQKWVLEAITDNCTVLIIGGGTGEIIEWLAIRFTNLKVVYVDKSAAMLKRAMQRDRGTLKVSFHQVPVEQLKLSGFQFCVTPFLCDLFQEKDLVRLVKQIDTYLVADGKWLNIDFDTSHTASYWQKMFLKSMYLFFRVVSNLKRINTVDLLAISTSYFQLISYRTFYGGFIRAEVYSKKSTGMSKFEFLSSKEL